MPTMAEEQHVGFETDENSHKKLRGSVLDHFSFISNNNEAKRIKNAALLLRHLLRNSNSENENSEVKYALNRLVRGLGSSKNSSRIGFYSTLVGLLSTFPSLKAEQVLECVQKQLQTGSTNSKSEIGDINTGKILACGAMIRSNMFLKASVEEQRSILEMLINAGKRRSYLGLAASSFIAELLVMTDADQFESIWPALKVEVLQSWQEQTLDSLYVLILIKNKFPEHLKSGTLKKSIGTREILCEENVKSICDILLDIPGASSLRHSAYSVISKEIAASDISSSFIAQLDRHLTFNRNRLLAVSIIIRNMLPNLKDTSQIPELLSTNFVKQMLQYFRNHHNNNYDQEFQEAMMKLFQALCSSLENDKVEVKTKIAVLKTILFYPGSFMIDNITKSKTVQQIVRNLNAEGVKKLSKLFKDVVTAKKDKVIDENVTEMWLNSERIYAAQLLTKLLNHASVANELEWKVEILKLLINLGIVKHHKYTNVGAELSNTLRDIFFRALDQRFPKLESMSTVLLELTNHIESSFSSENHEDALRVPLTEEEFDLFQQMYAITKKLEAKKEKSKYALVFQILFLHMGLHLFKDKELAVSSLKELFSCYERVKRDKKQKKLEGANEEDPEWIEVIVDLFLNLLSHSSHLLRNIIGCVFPHLCKYMTPSSVHQILSVLDPKNETNPLSHAEESDSDESDSEKSEKSDDEEGDGENESESDEEAEFEENETINDKLRMAVRSALGNDGYQTDEESIDLDDMSDSEGRRLDEALAEAFKQYKPNKGKNGKKQTKDAQTLTHFRVRVLDLVEIYLDSEPSMLSCLEIMLPLLQTLEFTIKDEHQMPLQMRVKHCLKKLKNLKKFGSTDGITEAVLGDLLNSLLDKGTKSAMIIQDMSTEISDCCIFIIKCSQMLQSAETFSKKTKKKLKEKMIEILMNAINMYFNQRDCLIPYYLFKAIFQLNWAGIVPFVPVVFEFAFNKETRPFRRSQALELLKIFYLNRRIQGIDVAFQQHIGEHDAVFCSKVVEMLDEFCKNPKTKKFKERFMYHVFNLLKAMASHPVKGRSIDWTLLGDKVREYRSFVTLSKDAKVAYNQLCGQLRIPSIVKMQKQPISLVDEQDDESDEEGNAARAEEKKKRKGKGALDSKKLKKEARALRFQSLSEGLASNFSFSSVNMNDISKQSSDNEAEAVNMDSRKRRQNAVTNEDSVDESIGSRDDAEDSDASPAKIRKKVKNKQISNGVLTHDVQSPKLKSKKPKKRISNEDETQSNGISAHKRKKHN